MWLSVTLIRYSRSGRSVCPKNLSHYRGHSTSASTAQRRLLEAERTARIGRGRWRVQHTHSCRRISQEFYVRENLGKYPSVEPSSAPCASRACGRPRWLYPTLGGACSDIVHPCQNCPKPLHQRTSA